MMGVAVLGPDHWTTEAAWLALVRAVGGLQREYVLMFFAQGLSNDIRCGFRFGDKRKLRSDVRGQWKLINGVMVMHTHGARLVLSDEVAFEEAVSDMRELLRELGSPSGALDAGQRFVEANRELLERVEESERRDR